MNKFISIAILTFCALNICAADLLKDPSLKHASYSFYAKYLTGPKAGKAVFAHNTDLRLIPGSSAKLFTTAAALNILGPDFRFETQFYKDKKNNLYIKGAGDPSLQIADLEAAAARLGKVKNIYIDNSLFNGSGAPPKATWEDIGNYYASTSEALNINNNRLDICLDPATHAVKSISPEVPGLFVKTDIVEKIDASMKTEDIFAYTGATQNDIILRGKINPLSSVLPCVKAAIPNPPLFAAQALKKFLKTNGKIFTEDKINYEDKTLAYSHFSLPVSELIMLTNQKSINLYTDALIKTLCAAKHGVGNYDCGLEELNAYLNSLGIETDAVTITDASGLSRETLVTTDFFVAFLEAEHRSPSFEIFYNSLIKDGEAAYKTGSLSGVRAHAGYAKDRTGNLIAFTLISNNYIGKNTEVSKVHMALINTLSELK